MIRNTTSRLTHTIEFSVCKTVQQRQHSSVILKTSNGDLFKQQRFYGINEKKDLKDKEDDSSDDAPDHVKVSDKNLRDQEKFATEAAAKSHIPQHEQWNKKILTDTEDYRKATEKDSKEKDSDGLKENVKWDRNSSNNKSGSIDYNASPNDNMRKQFKSQPSQNQGSSKNSNNSDYKESLVEGKTGPETKNQGGKSMEQMTNTDGSYKKGYKTNNEELNKSKESSGDEERERARNVSTNAFANSSHGSSAERSDRDLKGNNNKEFSKQRVDPDKKQINDIKGAVAGKSAGQAVNNEKERRKEEQPTDSQEMVNADKDLLDQDITSKMNEQKHNFEKGPYVRNIKERWQEEKDEIEGQKILEKIKNNPNKDRNEVNRLNEDLIKQTYDTRNKVNEKGFNNSKTTRE